MTFSFDEAVRTPEFRWLIGVVVIGTIAYANITANINRLEEKIEEGAEVRRDLKTEIDRIKANTLVVATTQAEIRSDISEIKTSIDKIVERQKAER